jgi:hypothetical protein
VRFKALNANFFERRRFVSWLTLNYGHRSLSYTCHDDPADFSDNVVDLKKIKNVTVVRNGKNLSAPESSLPVLVVDATDRSIYLQVPLPPPKVSFILQGSVIPFPVGFCYREVIILLRFLGITIIISPPYHYT